ncbi:MAG: FAD-dependent oxidoreductase [Archaeoglobaceae archaeon]|nr:FAD-dependent oxidoreductase [Archaeoglobaceae archaeon]
MKVDVLVIGGSPVGITAAITAKETYPDAEVTLVRKERLSVVPCGIPYIFGTIGEIKKCVNPDGALTANGVNLIIDEVVDVDINSKTAKLASGDEISFEKLVLSTGSYPVAPPIEGKDLEGVYMVYKDPDHIEKMLKAAKEAENIVIVGGGFIGVEFADELLKLNKNVTIVEILPHLLQVSFDDEFCAMAENKLRDMGVNIITNTSVKRILGNGKVSGVELSNGEKLDADFVLLSTGARPNLELAQKMGLEIGRFGVKVDDYMRTSHPDVFAVGDCAEKRCFFTGKPIPLMLASIGCVEARIAGSNLFEIKRPRTIKGVVSAFATAVGDLALGGVGFTERRARDGGYNYFTGWADVPNKHPPTLPRTSNVRVKLVFDENGKYLIGGQVAGPLSCGEIVNTISLAIQFRATLYDLLNLQFATQPLLTPGPGITSPIVEAAKDALLMLE